MDALLDETRHTGQTLAEELHELRKMENYRREFIGNVSHELKTPIFSIRGFSETLLEGALEDERVRRSFVEKIMRNADRLRQLASDLSEIARIETGELKMTVAAFATAAPRHCPTIPQELHAVLGGLRYVLLHRRRLR